MTYDQFELVIIETPYAGDVELNLRYLRACMPGGGIDAQCTEPSVLRLQ